jgi:ATP synthase protein I
MARSNEEGAMWSIFGYLLSGLLVWGGIGAAVDHWVFHKNHYGMLGGFLLGMGAALYLVWMRFIKE